MSALRFPNETPEYRKARNELLTAERELRRRIEEIAVKRRELPIGGPVPEDYVFEGDREGAPVRLSELFDGKSSLLVYSFMFGPTMEKPCPMCTSFLDSLDGAAPHIQQRAALAIVAKSPVARIREVVRSRGWRNLRIVSSANNSYNRDYHGEEEDGSQESMMNVFTRRDGDARVLHFYATELNDSEPGQNSRHLDMMWPVWTAFDLTPEGRGATWYPKLAY
jgi:predicted dithiol-disulfide oxidoreductase (DUF899 family)